MKQGECSRQIHAHVANAPRPLQGRVSAVHGNRRTAAQASETGRPVSRARLGCGLARPGNGGYDRSPEHVNNWGDLIDIELNPVVEDAQAAEAAARVFGK